MPDGRISILTEDVTSDMSALFDVPLDVEIAIDDAEYARIMRRITIDDSSGTDTESSAFNSSI
jgi:hypothetical protein